MPPSVLCLNAGSSSLKFALYEAAANGLRRRMHGAVEKLGTDDVRAWHAMENAERRQADVDIRDHAEAATWAAQTLHALGMPPPSCVGHRVVHGGTQYAEPVRLNKEVLAELHKLVPLAPLHQPPALNVIEAVREAFPDVVHVACFDTAIHRRMPEIAQRLPLPDRLWNAGVRRYGFHGLSLEYLLDQCAELRQGRTIILHLGHGASATAFLDGLPQDTTMGFTPTGGLMMGTRSGDLDPGVLIHLMQEHNYGPRQINDLVNRESGLRGVSGLSGDMRELEQAAPSNEQAALAIEMYCWTVARHTAALTTSLGGLDRLVFTAGIGEHSSLVRAGVCRRLSFLGIELNDASNERSDAIITTNASPCVVQVLPTDEEAMIAHHALASLCEG